jgi:hypothetical protein
MANSKKPKKSQPYVKRARVIAVARAAVLQRAAESAKDWLKMARLVEQIGALVHGEKLPLQEGTEVYAKVDELTDRLADYEYVCGGDTLIATQLAESLGLDSEGP